MVSVSLADTNNGLAANTQDPFSSSIDRAKLESSHTLKNIIVLPNRLLLETPWIRDN
jgi:hypothetical protein